MAGFDAKALLANNKTLEKSSKTLAAEAEAAEARLCERLEEAGALEKLLEVAAGQNGIQDYYQNTRVIEHGQQTTSGALAEQSAARGELDDDIFVTPKQRAARDAAYRMEDAHSKTRDDPERFERKHSMERELFEFRKQSIDHRIGNLDAGGAPVAKPVLSGQWREAVANAAVEALEQGDGAVVDAIRGVGDAVGLLAARKAAHERIAANNDTVLANEKALAGPSLDGPEPPAAKLEDPGAQRAIRAAAAEERMMDILDRNGLLDPFIKQAMDRHGIRDHYRETPLSGGATTTGKQIDSYLNSPLNIGVNDKFHVSDKQSAEEHAKRAMFEAHGKAVSFEHQATARVTTASVKEAEDKLYDLRKERADHAVAQTGFLYETRGMSAEQIRDEGLAAPKKPPLPEEWRKILAREAVLAVMGKLEPEREAQRLNIAQQKSLGQAPEVEKAIQSKDWPWESLPGKDRSAMLSAMLERQTELSKGRQDARERAQGAQAQQVPEARRAVKAAELKKLGAAMQPNKGLRALIGKETERGA
jgi:hypothetical protein